MAMAVINSGLSTNHGMIVSRVEVRAHQSLAFFLRNVVFFSAGSGSAFFAVFAGSLTSRLSAWIVLRGSLLE